MREVPRGSWRGRDAKGRDAEAKRRDAEGRGGRGQRQRCQKGDPKSQPRRGEPAAGQPLAPKCALGFGEVKGGSQRAGREVRGAGGAGGCAQLLAGGKKSLGSWRGEGRRAQPSAPPPAEAGGETRQRIVFQNASGGKGKNKKPGLRGFGLPTVSS